MVAFIDEMVAVIVYLIPFFKKQMKCISTNTALNIQCIYRTRTLERKTHVSVKCTGFLECLKLALSFVFGPSATIHSCSLSCCPVLPWPFCNLGYATHGPWLSCRAIHCSLALRFFFQAPKARFLNECLGF